MQRVISVGSDRKLYDVIFNESDDIYVFCNALTDYIINKYPDTIIDGIIRNKYSYLDKEETEKIKECLFEEDVLPDRTYIYEKLINYLSTENTLSLNGFITFRLGEYIKNLENMIDIAVNKLIRQYEYEEFIELLKFFVDIQTPVIDTVHIIKNNERYVLLNEQYDEITNEHIDDFIHELHYGNINYDDLLLSSLITLAPNKIYIYRCEEIKNKELLITLQKIFCDRLCMRNNAEYATLAKKAVILNKYN